MIRYSAMNGGESLSTPRLAKLVEKFADTSVLVIGDLMLDHYVWGSVNRISPEAPVVVVDVTKEEFRFGGAGNTAHNLRSLGAKVHLCGVIGDDASGTALIEMLEEKGIDGAGVIVEAGRVTTRKQRVIAHSQQVVRIDHEVRSEISAETTARLIDVFESKLPNIQAIVVSDYAKGVIVPSLFKAIDRARAKGVIGKDSIPVLIDPKEPNYGIYSYATVIKPNRSEAQSATGMKITDRPSALKAAEQLLDRWNTDLVLVTLGEDGLVLIGKGDRGYCYFESETAALEVYDVSGAGDTVIAIFALSLAARSELQQAAMLANIGAGLVVAEVGTAVVTRDQLEDALLNSRPGI